MFANQYQGKRVLITGHTGFKGSWLAEWLLLLGAEVSGYSLEVGALPNHFSALGLAARMTHYLGDVRDAQALTRAIHQAQPDFVFHLAAQALVRRSYRDPVETFSTNIIGTVQVLEAVRQLARPVVCVVVTSDKCYENREVLYGYREDDALGGHDPYSASKGAAELVTQAYRRSFFSHPDTGVRVASARAGNVIGGGDWAEDRIIPDCVANLMRGASIPVRNLGATRPWQHVLEPLSGYLWLGALLTGKVQFPGAPTALSVSNAFNFGPLLEANRSVQALVTELLCHWPGHWHDASTSGAAHEAGRLNLAIDRAFHTLQWRPVWAFAQSVAVTAQWYVAVAVEQQEALQQTRNNILTYMADARQAQLRWAAEC